ncbi:YncE family protein [Kushneria sp. AK178]
MARGNAGALRWSSRLIAAVAAAVVMGGIVSTGVVAQPTAPQVSKSVKLDHGLYEAVYSPDQQQLLVAGGGSRGDEDGGRIFRLNPKTLATLDTLHTLRQVFGLAVDPVQHRLYATGSRDGSLTVVDDRSGEVLATLVLADPDKPLPEGETKPAEPRHVVIDQNRERAYITGVANDGRVWVVNTRTLEQEAAIEHIGKRPTGLVLDEARHRLYVTLLGEDAIAVIDLDRGKRVATWPTRLAGPIDIDMDHKRQRLLVTSPQSGALEVVDADNGRSLGHYPAGDGALGVTLDPDNDHVYIANRNAGTVTVLDGEDYHEVTTLATGTHPNTVTIDPITHHAFVTNKAARVGKQDDPDDAQGNTVTLITP